MADYTFSKSVKLDMEAAENLVRETLQTEGFGVLTEIDVAKTFDAKLGVSIEPYKILGACNPGLAYNAILLESRIGTMLPCNVILRKIEDGITEVSAVDPVKSMMAVENKDLGAIAIEVRDRLARVIDQL